MFRLILGLSTLTKVFFVFLCFDFHIIIEINIFLVLNIVHLEHMLLFHLCKVHGLRKEPIFILFMIHIFSSFINLFVFDVNMLWTLNIS